MRGAVGEVSELRGEVGIIPARAGSRAVAVVDPSLYQDHPRACGEQMYPCQRLTELPGSSPRVRGAAEHRLDQRGQDGIIPARAGSSPTARTWRPARRDHPRACGEQYGTYQVERDGMGSSPRVRGAVDGDVAAVLVPGIIPARAGSSTLRVARRT